MLFGAKTRAPRSVFSGLCAVHIRWAHEAGGGIPVVRGSTETECEQSAQHVGSIVAVRHRRPDDASRCAMEAGVMRGIATPAPGAASRGARAKRPPLAPSQSPRLGEGKGGGAPSSVGETQRRGAHPPRQAGHKRGGGAGRWERRARVRHVRPGAGRGRSGCGVESVGDRPGRGRDVEQPASSEFAATALAADGWHFTSICAGYIASVEETIIRWHSICSVFPGALPVHGYRRWRACHRSFVRLSYLHRSTIG